MDLYLLFSYPCKTKVKRLFTILFLIGASLPGITFSRGVTLYPLTGHPRLFFLASDEVVLKEKLNSTPDLSKIHNLILAESNGMIGLPVQQRILTGKRLLSVSREALRRISFLSYAYRMTGEAGYASRAETEMLAMAAFPDWNPSHFLDVGEMTLAMAIGYDWLFGYLSPLSRTTIASAIKLKGIEETTGSKANQSWLKDDNNWNQVCNAGISAGVAAVYDENPAYYQPLIDRAVTSVKIPMGVYQYNGSYPEGMGYWDYGTTFNILFIDMLQRMWGTDRDLLTMEGFLKTVNFVTHMQGTGTRQMSGGTLKSVNPQPFNFADCGTGIGVLPGMFWLASRSSDQTVLYNEMQKLVFLLANGESSLTNNRLLPFLLIWSLNLTLANLPAPVETAYIAQGKSAVAALRTGWKANDIYLAVKGGTPSSNHAHMDIGSFVMDAMDVRWAMDFGASDYNTLETNGVDLWNMSQNSERWDVFRYHNLSHNTLTFNGNKQLVTGNSPVKNLVSKAGLQSIELDLTSLYQNDVSSCRRVASIVANRYVEITDSIRAGSKNLTVRWNLLTQAVPRKVSNKIINLSQSTKTLYLVFEGTDAVTAKTWTTRPSTSYEEKNSDSWFTGFEFSVSSGTSMKITVKLVPAGDPVLNGLDLTANGKQLDEDFESFQVGSLSGDFITWKMNPASNGSMKAILGEVVLNPFKSGINASEKVLRIIRQDDIEYITPSNAGSVTYRGAQAFGYDLRVNQNSIVEFKYYKDAAGKAGIRIYDGNGPFLLSDFTDPYEITTGYNTAQWRTAQFEVGKLDLSKFSFTPSGYLLISPERNGTEAYQEKTLTIYIDDVKMIPLSTRIPEIFRRNTDLAAFMDPASGRICVFNLPENTKEVRLYDILGHIVHEVRVSGDMAMLDVNKSASQVFIVKALCSDGTSKSLKVVRNVIVR
jgi:oligo-alginate lyase